MPRVNEPGPVLTWAAALAMLEDRPGGKNVPVGAGGASIKTSTTFSGASYADAVQRMRHGWPEGVRDMEAVRVTERMDSIVAPVWSLEAAGHFPLVPAFLAGEPECMWRRTDDDALRPRAALVLSVTYPASISAGEAARFGAALSALLAGALAAGQDVAVYGVDAGHRGHNVAGVQGYVFRDFGEPVDLSKIAFAVSPAFLRRTVFAVREQSPYWAARGMHSGGYGYSDPATAENAAVALGELAAGRLIILPSLGRLQFAGLLDAMEGGRLLALLRELLESGIASGLEGA